MRKLSSHEAFKATNGTSLKGKITGVSYSDLIRVFGEPTTQTPYTCDKVHYEWAFVYKERVFTIYDYCTYCAKYSREHLTRWNVGGHVSSDSFVDEVQTLIKSK